MNYLEKQNEWIKFHDLKVGDEVIVVEKCNSRERGWDDAWMSTMDKFISKTCIVKSIKGKNGIDLSYSSGSPTYNFPYFILFVKPKTNSVLVELNPNYKASYIYGNTVVNVGCQEIPIENIRKLINEIDDLNKRYKSS